jgi:HPt (histidine-containing phosphotransfer) domain-containing protein
MESNSSSSTEHRFAENTTTDTTNFDSTDQIASSAALLDQACPVDWANLRARVDGDLDLLTEMIEIFLSTSPALLAEIEAAVAAEDCPTVARAAHCLKGALLNISATDAAQAAVELEQCGRQDAAAQLAARLTMLKIRSRRLQNELSIVAQDLADEKQDAVDGSEIVLAS